MAEYRYNGLDQRITTHFDTDADKDVDGNDVTSHFVYDGRWRMAARYEDTNTDPTEQWVFHHAGLAEGGGSSYIDSVILRDRDTTANGTLDERVYYLQNWRADVVALITDAGDQIEQIRYEPYGSPFGLPAGDTDGDGDVDQADVDQVTSWYNASAYDSRGDLNMDGAVNLTDITRATAAKVNGDTLGLYFLSLVDNRKGYAGYEALAELDGAAIDIRACFYNAQLGENFSSGASTFRCSQVLDSDEDDSDGTECNACRDGIVQTDPGDPCSCWSQGNPMSPLLWIEWNDILALGCQPPNIGCYPDLDTPFNRCDENGKSTIAIPCIRFECSTLLHELVHARQCCEQFVDCKGPSGCSGPGGPFTRQECLEWEIEAYDIQGLCDGFTGPARVICLCNAACDSCSCLDARPIPWGRNNCYPDSQRNECMRDCWRLMRPFGPNPFDYLGVS